MASITKRKGKKGISWRAHIRIAGHKAITSTFDKQSKAAEWAENTEKALKNGGYVGPDPPGDKDFSGALDRYMDEVSILKRPNSRAREITVSKHLYSFFSGMTLRGISADMVAAFRDQRLKIVTGSTIQKELALLSHLYTVARRDWALNIENPVSCIRKPSVNRGRTRFLTNIEARMLLDCCCESRNKKLYPYVLLLLHSGMRPSEAAGIRWEQIDLEKRIIDLTVTKTVPRRAPFSEKAKTTVKQLYVDGCQPTDFVFLRQNPPKRLLRRPSLYFRRSLDNAIRYAELDNFHAHDIRHTAASYLIMAGVDLRTLAEILGHKSMDMVMRYAHLIDDHKVSAIDKINDIGF